jgi:nitronate monooxygenase
MGDRRDFLKRTAALATAVGVRDLSLSAQARAAMPTPRASAFMAAFGLKYPICNAGMGTAASPELAIAVANAGGLGATGTGLGFGGPVASAANDAMRQVVTRIRAGTKGPFAVNYLLVVDPVTLPGALDAGAPIIQFAWGIPSAEVTGAIRRAGAKMGVQVASAAGARRALDAGADYLICQGTEAGGHVQATTPLYETLQRVIDMVGAVPVIAAGGIAHGAHIRRALLAGASGVLVGTRFIATKEATAHDEYKTALTRGRAADTVLTVCFQDGWTNAPHRVLRNQTLTMWEAAGCPPPGKRPGEGDVISTHVTTGVPKLRYRTSMPYPTDRGNVTDLALYAGTGVDAVRDIPSAGELLPRLWKECLDAG